MELQATMEAGKLFHRRIVAWKKECWYVTVRANWTKKRWWWPLTVAAVGIRHIVGIATRLLTMWNIMMTLFAALLSCRIGHCKCECISLTPLVRWKSPATNSATLIVPWSRPTSEKILYSTCCWSVVLKINVDLAIVQQYLDLEAGDNQFLKIQVARPGIEPRSSCSASQELNHSATTAPIFNL